jgi:hypothetical protein
MLGGGFWETRSALKECSCGRRGGRNQPCNPFVSPGSVHRRSSLSLLRLLLVSVSWQCGVIVWFFPYASLSGEKARRVFLTQLLLLL